MLILVLIVAAAASLAQAQDGASLKDWPGTAEPSNQKTPRLELSFGPEVAAYETELRFLSARHSACDILVGDPNSFFPGAEIMWIKKLAGVTLVAVGIGCLGHYIDRCYNLTGEDRAFWARVADTGGTSATEGHGPAWKFLMLGVGATILGTKLFKDS